MTVSEEPLSGLEEYPGNPRRGDVAAIAASLEGNGQFQPLVVQASTSRVLSGNHTLAAMRLLGWDTALVRRLDVDDEQARKVVLAANRTFDLGGFDDAALLSLLQDVAPDDLDATGYSLDDLTDLAGPAAVPFSDDEIEALKHGPIFTADGSRTSEGRRIIVLDMPSPLFEWMQTGLAAVRQQQGLTTTVETLAYLLRTHAAGLRAAPEVLA